MTRSLVGTAVFICALLLVSSAFAGASQVHQRARLDHYARPAPHQSRMLNSRMHARVQHQKTYQSRMQRTRAYQPPALRRIKHRARFVEDYSSRRVIRHLRPATSRRHMKGPARLTKPPRLITKIRCAELSDQCLPQQSTKPSTKQATKSSTSRPKTLKDKTPAKLKEKRDSMIRCPDGDCSL